MGTIADLLNMNISPLEVIVRLLIAAVGGGIIGWPREKHDKNAGLRTHMIVCLGSATFMLLAMDIMVGHGQSFDPLRVLTGIITGVGFLGAGSIIQSRGSVHGMTTAAGIWLVAGIGAMCGAGAYGLAVLTTALGWIIITPLNRLKYHYEGKNEDKKSDSPG